MRVFVNMFREKYDYQLMNDNIRFELSFKNISQLEKKLNFCKFNKLKNINIPCKGVIKKELFNSTITEYCHK